MGELKVSCKIENHTDRTKAVRIPKVLVNKSSECTWIPAAKLEKIGVVREKDVHFIMANGETAERSVGFAILRVRGKHTIDEVVFAERGDSPVLGARTLHGLQLSFKTEPDHSVIPPFFYKYYAFSDWTQEIFERNEIYFQSPDGFNDPFDSKLSYTYEETKEQKIKCWVALLQKGRRRGLLHQDNQALRSHAASEVEEGKDVPLMLTTLKRSPEKIRKQLGIYCMTSKPDNMLMWSHYAADHRGFCLEFTTKNAFFRKADEAPLLPVEYRPDRPCLNRIERGYAKNEIAHALVTKAEDWTYEKEWRLVDFKRGPGLHKYPAKALTGVILGCRISPANGARIMQWCRRRRPRPTVY